MVAKVYYFWVGCENISHSSIVAVRDAAIAVFIYWRLHISPCMFRNSYKVVLLWLQVVRARASHPRALLWGGALYKERRHHDVILPNGLYIGQGKFREPGGRRQVVTDGHTGRS